LHGLKELPRKGKEALQKSLAAVELAVRATAKLPSFLPAQATRRETTLSDGTVALVDVQKPSESAAVKLIAAAATRDDEECVVVASVPGPSRRQDLVANEALEDSDDDVPLALRGKFYGGKMGVPGKKLSGAALASRKRKLEDDAARIMTAHSSGSSGPIEFRDFWVKACTPGAPGGMKVQLTPPEGSLLEPGVIYAKLSE
jgi:hypothetical protein